jgi:pimeloyl-ACP methyl ester carboxylesterase
MHWWQWAIYVLLLVVVLHEFDSGFRVTLRGNVTVKQLEGKRNHDILIVYLPGLLADGEWSARMLTDAWRDFGDVWLADPAGDRFEYDLLTSKLAGMLEADTHRHVVIIGSSLGADNALDIMSSLSRHKRVNTLFDLLAICTPSAGVGSIKQPFKLISGLAFAMRFGPATNATWGPFFTKGITGKQPRTFAMTYYVDQVNYVRSQPDPDPKLLTRFRSVLYLQAGDDELVSKSAASAWVPARNVIVVDGVKHVSYEDNPEEWNAAFHTALSRLGMR